MPLGGALSQQQIEAAEEFARTTIETLKTERGIHAETAIAGTARMAGTFLFRSFNFSLKDAKPGSPMAGLFQTRKLASKKFSKKSLHVQW